MVVESEGLLLFVKGKKSKKEKKTCLWSGVEASITESMSKVESDPHEASTALSVVFFSWQIYCFSKRWYLLAVTINLEIKFLLFLINEIETVWARVRAHWEKKIFEDKMRTTPPQKIAEGDTLKKKNMILIKNKTLNFA